MSRNTAKTIDKLVQAGFDTLSFSLQQERGGWSLALRYRRGVHSSGNLMLGDPTTFEGAARRAKGVLDMIVFAKKERRE